MNINADITKITLNDMIKEVKKEIKQVIKVNAFIIKYD